MKESSGEETEKGAKPHRKPFHRSQEVHLAASEKTTSVAMPFN